jgi:RNA polymerase sigma-70 factor (ECF subfamily)
VIKGWPICSARDEQLMWRVKLRGDEEAFARLVARWEPPLRSMCYRMTGDTHQAEDLTQSAFSRVFARREGWEPTGKFSTYLWRVALNLCHDELRRFKRRGECSLEVLEEEGAVPPESMSEETSAPDDLAEKRERADLVKEALLKLAPHYREVVILRHYEHLKFSEIGVVLSIPEGTVKSRMSEALSQLSTLLKPVSEEMSWKPKNETLQTANR